MKTVYEDPKNFAETNRKMDDSIRERAVERGEPTFTLIGRDPTSPKTICFWIMENIETASAGKLIDALQDALLMRATKNRCAAD